MCSGIGAASQIQAELFYGNAFCIQIGDRVRQADACSQPSSAARNLSSFRDGLRKRLFLEIPEEEDFIFFNWAAGADAPLLNVCRVLCRSKGVLGFERLIAAKG